MTYISVIVPFLNEKDSIEKCILNILDQDYPRHLYEIIFVDNGSTDSSSKIVKKYKRVKLLTENRGNDFTARDKAIKIAKGEILAFVDADCTPDPRWLKTIVNEFKKNKTTHFVVGKNIPVGNGLMIKLAQKYDNQKAKYITAHNLKKHYFGYTNNMAIRKNVFDELKGFNNLGLRNADIKIIHEYLSINPNAELNYLPKAVVTHLELDSYKTWLKKQLIYGYRNKKCKTLKGYENYRILPLSIRFNILRTLIRTNVTLFEIPALFFVLLFGQTCYFIGELLANLANLKQTYIGKTHTT